METDKLINIAFFGGSFNPPHQGHKEIIKHLLEYPNIEGYEFDTVIVKPSGLRKDKPNSFKEVEKRKNIIENYFEEFKDNKKFKLITNKMDHQMTSTYDECNFLRRMSSSCRVWIVVGQDLLEMTKSPSLGNIFGSCEITSWKHSSKLLEEEYFYIIPREMRGDRIMTTKPLNYSYAEQFNKINISSTELRQKEKNDV